MILSRIPLEYNVWRKIGFFKHGRMLKAKYAYEVFKKHYDSVSTRVGLNNFIVLELGPGDSLFTAMIASTFGANRCYLVDTSFYAASDLEPYRDMASFIANEGMKIPDISSITTLDELLLTFNACYGTKGLETLYSLPEDSVDFVFSQAVLEHIRKQDFLETMQQLRRIIKKDGICSHCIDFRDHLGGNLNNLRFSEKLWESDFFARSGFYTNRIRYQEMAKLFRKAGFNTEVIQLKRWDKLPISKTRLSDKFRELSDENLCVSGCDVILRPV